MRRALPGAGRLADVLAAMRAHVVRINAWRRDVRGIARHGIERCRLRVDMTRPG